MKYSKLLILLYFLIFHSEIFSQFSTIYTGKIHKAGLNLSYTYNAHKVNFNQLPNVPSCCPHYESGFGNGFSAHLFYEYTFINRLSAGVKIGVESLYGKLTSNENQYIFINEKPELATIGHNLEGKILNLFIMPNLNYQIIYGMNLFCGFSIGFLISKNYYQIERLITPENYGTFENGLRYRNEKSGTISGNNTIIAFFNGGVSYDFPLESSNTFLIAPEISFSYQLNSFLKESLWKTTVIKFGLSFKFSPGTSLATPIKPQDQ